MGPDTFLFKNRARFLRAVLRGITAREGLNTPRIVPNCQIDKGALRFRQRSTLVSKAL